MRACKRDLVLNPFQEGGRVIESSPADYIVEGSNTKIDPDNELQLAQLHFPAQSNHFEQLFSPSTNPSETWGGLTQIGWVLISLLTCTTEESDTLLLVRDSYANQLHRIPGKATLEQCLRHISYPVDVNQLFLLDCPHEAVIELDEKLVSPCWVLH